MSANQASYVRYVAEHPGCSVAQVDRACRVNPQAGHRWVYDGVARLVRRGLLCRIWLGARWALYAGPKDAAKAEGGGA